MSENIYYNLQEKEVDKNVDCNSLYKNYIENNILESCDDVFFALRLNYSSNYTVSDIKKILEFYIAHEEISKDCIRKKRKEEMIDELVIFEINESNKDIVSKRKRLWFYIKEIKGDKYLSKYIIFN